MTARSPSLLDALLPIGVLVVLLSLSVYLFGDGSSSGPNQIALMSAAFVAGLVGLKNGLRWAEMVGLRVKDIDFERRRIRVSENAVEVDGIIEVGTPKSHKRRTVPFPHLLDPALRPLVEGKGPDELVFADKRGMYLRRTRVSTASRSWFVTARIAAGIPQMTIHDLRHTGATLAAATGATLADLMARLGHSTPGAAMIYQHSVSDRDKAIVAALSAMVSTADATSVRESTSGPQQLNGSPHRQSLSRPQAV